MGGYSRREKKNKEFAENATSSLPVLPSDVSEGDDGLLRYADGTLVKDGLYLAHDGELVMYEGNFESGNVFIDG